MTNISTASPTFIPCPFATESDAAFVLQNTNVAHEIDISEGIKNHVVKSKGHKAVPRAKFNGMLNLATQMPFYMQCGGTYTFDETISSFIGGYPKGAVLTYIVGNSFNFVTSMKDNNKDNFVSNPAFIDGNSWKMTTFSLIYPDYTRPIEPNGTSKLCYVYPYQGDANTFTFTTRHGYKTCEYSLKKSSGGFKINSYNAAMNAKQPDSGYYFRVLSEREGQGYKNYVTTPPEQFENRSVNTGLKCGAQIYCNKRGWFYLSLARVANTSVYTNACGGKTYFQGNPNCALITISDNNMGVTESNGVFNTILNSTTLEKGKILSSSFAGHQLAHQCYAWSLQLLIRRACYITIWQDCNPFYMFYNYFELKK